MTTLFEAVVDQPSPQFRAIRDRPELSQIRALAEQLWAEYQPYADPDFPGRFARDVHPRFWEMYLCTCLVDRGFHLMPKISASGPDLHIRLKERDLWIEATAPGEGEGPDAVPSLDQHAGFNPIPEDKIILRFTNAIAEKAKKCTRYVKAGILSPFDSFVIAINGAGIGLAAFEAPLPAVVKAVYPVGQYQVTLDADTLQTIRSGYLPRGEISKSSGSPVPTGIFLDSSYSAISGVLYSSAALWSIPNPPGSEFRFVHNSVAASPLPVSWIGLGSDYYWHDNGIAEVRN